ncbi:Spy/CpxP family protein refolding chaperone [Pelagibacterium mangrovi]|uniref:Spy/CpxP family protein refolding chaperone n=1 Tax=Pelagibacterium mangrovi TaxID=3119828 RepID=UPI002FCAB994
MKIITKTALVALAAASIGATSFAPAFAQPFGGGHHAIQRVPGGEARSFRPGPDAFGGFGMGGGLIGMFLMGNAEVVDIAAVRLTHRLDLSDEQQELLENLRLAALDAQGQIAEIREEFSSSDEDAATASDITARYAAMVAMTTARAEALEAIQPSFEAFVESLDDTQLETLTPQHPGRPHEGGPRTMPEAEG